VPIITHPLKRRLEKRQQNIFGSSISPESGETSRLRGMEGIEMASEHFCEQRLFARPVAMQDGQTGARLGAYRPDRGAAIAVLNKDLIGGVEKALAAKFHGLP
jgi:hypothetical protein